AAKRRRYLIVGWLWYVVTLVPVIGLLQVGSQARADRYTYIPLIGMFIIAAWGISDLLKKWHYRKETLLALSAMSLACCFIVTWIQVGYWRDSLTLFEHALKVTTNNFVAHNARGDAYGSLGNHKQAIVDYDRAIEINPKYTDAYNNRGAAYVALGNHKLATEDYDRAIEIDPKFAADYYNKLGNTYVALGNYKLAIEDYDRAIE